MVSSWISISFLFALVWFDFVIQVFATISENC